MTETPENNTLNVLEQGDVEEDDSLDNFFKKKDKKGKKKKSKKSDSGIYNTWHKFKVQGDFTKLSFKQLLSSILQLTKKDT